jgi:glutamine synthetase
VYIGWAQQNRSALIRIPRSGPRKPARGIALPDPAANPYLAFAAMLGAALDGIDRQLECPKPLNNINVYHLTPTEREVLGVAELPGSLAEALRELDKDEVLKEALGPVAYEAFQRAKWAEVEESRMKVTDWEVGRYLETA